MNMITFLDKHPVSGGLFIGMWICSWPATIATVVTTWWIWQPGLDFVMSFIFGLGVGGLVFIAFLPIHAIWNIWHDY